MKRRRIFAMMLVTLMLTTGLVGCATASVAPTAAATPVSTQTMAATDTPTVAPVDPFAEKIHFTATANPTSLSEGVSYMNDAMYDFLNKKFNFTIDVYPTTYDNWADKNRLWITSGDMPDLVFWNFDYTEYKNYAQQGLIKALPDGWEGTYLNLSKDVAGTGVQDSIKLDGKTYAIPHIIFGALSPVKTPIDHSTFYYRDDWRQKLGLEPFGDTITLDQMEAYLSGCITQKLSPAGYSASYAIGSTFVSMCNSAFNEFYKKDGQYVWGPAQPETLEGIKLFKKYYDKGLIDPDFYLNKSTDHRNKFYSELVCAIQDTGNVDDVIMRYEEFQKANPDLDAYSTIKLTSVTGPDGKWHGKAHPNFWSSSIFNPKMDQKVQDRLLSIFDYMSTAEGQEFVRMGIEGKDWKRTDSGYEILRAKNADGSYPTLGNVYPTFNFWWVYPVLPDDFSFVNPTSNKQVVNSVVNIYKAKAQGDVFAFDPDYFFFTSDSKSNYSVDLNSEIVKIIMDKNVNLDTAWAAFVETQKPMYQPVLDDLNKAIGK